MNQQIASGNMTDLEQQYKTLLSQYNALWSQVRTIRTQAQANQVSEQLKALNVQLGNILDRMLSFQTETPSQARDELVKRLAEIQRDYNGLLVSTDKLTTLRTIRAHESKAANQSLSLYLLIFVALAVFLLVLIFWKGSSQTSESTATTPTSPAVMNALT